MALRFADSFDHLATAEITQKWTSNSSSAIIASQGRRSTSALRVNSSATNVTKTLDAQATWIVGFALNIGSAPGGGTTILAFLDAGTVQTDIRVNADLTLTATRNGTALGSSTSALSTGTFYYIEVKVTISDAAGAVEVRVNGSSSGWISLTGVDTKNSANASANQIRLGTGTQSLGTSYYDDLYVCDSNGSTNNDFLGDVRVDAYVPDGNGNSSQMVGNDGNSTDNYLLVDDSTPDADSTYVESSTAGNKDVYAFPAMSHTPSAIYGVQINMIAKKDDAGARSIASVTRSGGSDTDGTTQALSTSYVDYLQISETDPNTSTAWTKTGFGNAEFGAKVAA